MFFSLKHFLNSLAVSTVSELSIVANGVSQFAEENSKNLGFDHTKRAIVVNIRISVCK